MIYIKCALGFCYECPEYSIPDKELDDAPNASIIHLSVYIYHRRYSIHGIIQNRPIVCISHEKIYDKNNSIIKSPTYGGKKTPNKNFMLYCRTSQGKLSTNIK